MDDWKDELHYFFRPEDDHRLDEPRAEASRFIQDVVLPALKDVAHELGTYGRDVRTSSHGTSATAVVRNRGHDEFAFTLEVQIAPDGLHPLVTSESSSQSGPRVIRTSENGQAIADLKQADVARMFTREYLSSFPRTRS